MTPLSSPEKTKKCKVLIYLRVWSFDPHARCILFADNWAFLWDSLEIVQNRRRRKCTEHASQKIRPSKRLELYSFLEKQKPLSLVGFALLPLFRTLRIFEASFLGLLPCRAQKPRKVNPTLDMSTKSGSKPSKISKWWGLLGTDPPSPNLDWPQATLTKSSALTCLLLDNFSLKSRLIKASWVSPLFGCSFKCGCLFLVLEFPRSGAFQKR